MWQAGPGESTTATSVSASQSTSRCLTCCMLPLVAPLFHSSWRERDQNQVVPVSRVSRSDSSLIQATMSTSPVPSCCTTQGMSPLASSFNCRSERLTTSTCSAAYV